MRKLLKHRKVRNLRSANMPAKYLTIVDEASEKDRNYFLLHPWLEQYERDYVPGEFWPLTYPIACRVLVIKHSEDMRTRRVIDSSPIEMVSR